jgi:hypothetical protein
MEENNNGVFAFSGFGISEMTTSNKTSFMTEVMFNCKDKMYMDVLVTR